MAAPTESYARSLRASRRRAEFPFRSRRDGRAAGSYELLEDGLLVDRRGRVEARRSGSGVAAGLPAGTPVIEHADSLLLPGFVDTHIHYCQTDVIASGGRQLLDWLEDYTFPAERRFAGRRARVCCGGVLSR